MKADKKIESSSGLFPSFFCKPRYTLNEIFAELERSQSESILGVVKNSEKGQFSARIDIAETGANGYWGLLHLADGLRIVIRDWIFDDARYEIYPGEGWFEFQLHLAGCFTIKSRKGDSFKIDGPTLFIEYHPNRKHIFKRTLSNSAEKSVVLYCKPNYLESKIFTEAHCLQKDIAQLINEEKGQAKRIILPLSSRLMEQTSSFFRFEFLSKLELVYAEAKARETLCLIFHEISKLKNTTLQSYKKVDINLIREAYCYLDQHFNPPPTITQLARKIGISETKLKNGFKNLYGITIFEFSHQKRMSHAMTLLQEERMSPSVVAGISGYQHQSTFTTAFRNYFGIRPKDVKKISQSKIDGT